MPDIIEDNIFIFKDICENLQGCMRTNEKEKFKCNGCEDFAKCFKVLNESVAAIAYWLAEFIKGTKDYENLKKKIENEKKSSMFM